jgi:hypothetical protein
MLRVISVIIAVSSFYTQAFAQDTWIPFGSNRMLMKQSGVEPTSMSHGGVEVTKSGTQSMVRLPVLIPGAMLSYPDDNGLLAGKYAALSLASEDIKLTQLNFNGSLQPDKLGMPDLPLVRLQVRIPFDAQKVNVTTANADFLPVEGEYEVAPVQEQLAESFEKGIDVDTRVFKRDAVVYEKSALFTHPLTFESMICHGIRFLEITYCPLKYNPITKKIHAAYRADIVINYTPGKMAEDDASDLFAETVNYVTFNGTGLSDQSEKAPAGEKFIVVSKSVLINTPTFQDYIAYRQNQGYVLVETVNADKMSVSDITAKIKSLYSSSKMDYVIILGDETIIPIPENPDTNYHYKTWSRLDGTDKIEDVGLGILLCDNEAKFKNIVQHQKWQEAGGDWAKTQLTTSGSEVVDGKWDRFSTGHYGTIHLDKPDGGLGYTVRRVYQVKSIPTKYGGSSIGIPTVPFESWTIKTNPFFTSGSAATAEIIKHWNAGVVNLSHRDHGGIGGPSSPPMSYTMFRDGKITSTCSPFFSSINCLTGNFRGHHTNNFAYLAQTSKYGTCTNIGATRVTYSGDNDNLHMAMYYAMYPKSKTTAPITNVGQIWLIAHMKGQSHSRTYFHIFGDPMTNLFLGQANIPFISLQSPNGGEEIEAGSTQTIVWGDNIPGNVKIELLKGTSVVKQLASTVPSNGSFSWVVDPDIVPGTDYKIKVTSLDQTGLSDQSNSAFKIVAEYFVDEFPFNEVFYTFDTASTELPYKWDQPLSNELPWIVWQGPTPSRVGTNPNRTGPMGDHTSGNGNYIYLEASGNYNEDGEFTTPKFNISTVNDPRLSFWYHMFCDTNIAGAMGSLYLDINVNGVWNDSVFKVSGNKGDRWIQKTVDLNPYKGNRVQFRFRGTTGKLFTSDICLDDFNISASGLSAIRDSHESGPKTFDLVSAGKELVFHVPNGNGPFAQVKIVLYDLQGKMVRTLFDGRAHTGANLIRMDKTGLAIAHGLYQCRMDAAGFSKTVPVIW